MPLKVLLVAGGTGGHLFPALALREKLIGAGHSVELATDDRVEGFVAGVPAENHHTVRSASVSTSDPLKLIRSLFVMLRGTHEARRLMGKLDPDIVVGFGGYPTVPPLIAAKIGRRPAVVHEQNAVVGRANRLLVRLGSHLAHGFPDPVGIASNRPATLVGNPVRSAVISASEKTYHPSVQGEAFNLLVFGGSQGAHVFSERVPAAIALLPDDLKNRMNVVQQARPEDLEATRAAYKALGVKAEVEPFFSDMPKRIGEAHFVISRAGASTVSEISVVGRPALLVPYPHALDHDQAANAASLEAAGGAWIIQEQGLSAHRLAENLRLALTDENQMSSMADASKSASQPNAVDNLVNLVERLAR